MIKLAIAALVALLLAAPALAGHKSNHNPPGQSVPEAVCDCLIVEVRESVFFHQDEITANPNLEAIIGGLMVTGALQCFDAGPGFLNRGEALFRAILDLLDEVPDPDLCR